MTPAAPDPARDIRKQVWAQIGAGSRARRWIAFTVLLILVATVQITDVFGFSSVSADKAREIVSRILAPWYNADEGQSAAVVLLHRDGDREWPPGYPQLAGELETILRQCPRAVVIDIFFDSRRYQPGSFGAFLTRVLEARAEAGCGPLPVPLILADDLDPRQPMLPELLSLAGGAWTEADYCRYRAELTRPSAIRAALAAAPPAAASPPPKRPRTGTRGRAANARRATVVPAEPAPPPAEERPSCPTTDAGGRPRWAQVALALAAWPSEEEDSRSRFHGLSNAEFYRLIGPKDEQQRNGGRASLALAAYFAHCAIIGCGKDPDRQAAMRRWLEQPGVSRQEVGTSLGRAFGTPQDIQWQRWSPPDHDRLWTSPDADCVLEGRGRVWGNVVESARLFALGFAGSSAAARRQERVPCYPFVTFDTAQHMVVFCDACRTALEPAAAEKWDALRRAIPGRLRDKVVFVGVGDPSSGDLVRSPAHEVLPGVFRHAMAFDNLVAWDDGYRRRPETSVVSGLGIDIGTNALAELAAMIIVALVAYWIREHAYHGAWDSLRSAMQRAGSDRCRAAAGVCRALALEALLIATVVAAMAIVSIACAILFHVVWGWAVVNWINVAAFSAIPVFLVTDRLDKRAAPDLEGPTQPSSIVKRQ